MILPLLLTVGVLLSGAIVALDRWWLRARRGPVDALAGVPEPMLVATARAVFPVLLFVWLLRSFVAEPFRIPSESMLPQLQVGDFVLVNKYAYGLRLPVLNTLVVPLGEPQRGDVMVFVPPHKNLYLIKRVIGLPGDRVSFRDGQLFVNGERATLELIAEREQRVRGVTLPALEYLETLDGAAHRIHRVSAARLQPSIDGEWRVPRGQYFVLGDNRDRSEDSRSWGFARDDQLVGKAVAVWMHKPPGWHWPSFARTQWLSREISESDNAG